VIVFDRRGRGGSDDGASPHSLAREVEDVTAILELAGPRAALAGHSFGGAVALEAARVAAPGAVVGVAVYEPAVGVGGTIAATAIDEMEELIASGDPDGALDIAIDGLDRAGLVHADAERSGARRPDTVLALAPTVPRELRAATMPGLPLDRYANLEVPALVLAGTASPDFQRRNCERLAASLPQARLAWLDGLGHVAHTAAPDVLAAELAGFLDSLPWSRAA
jgi:pimeloyl-ACP methyl ester carboxylesterase